jgi:hypothetical protein
MTYTYLQNMFQYLCFKINIKIMYETLFFFFFKRRIKIFAPAIINKQYNLTT